eukprot:g18586.t1
MVAVNVWDVCARKKTQRPAFQLEVQIKRAIVEFMGANTFTIKPGTGPLPSDSAGALTFEPAQSAAFKRAIMEQEQKEAAAKLFNYIARHAGVVASEGLGNKVIVYAKQALKSTGLDAKHLFVKRLTSGVYIRAEVGTEVRSAEGTDWGRILEIVPQLKPLIEEAGYQIGACSVGIRDGKKAWGLSIQWV